MRIFHDSSRAHDALGVLLAATLPVTVSFRQAKELPLTGVAACAGSVNGAPVQDVGSQLDSSARSSRERFLNKDFDVELEDRRCPGCESLSNPDSLQHHALSFQSRTTPQHARFVVFVTRAVL